MSVTTLHRRPLALVEPEPPLTPHCAPPVAPQRPRSLRRPAGSRSVADTVASAEPPPLRRPIRYTRRARLVLATGLLTGVVAAAVVGHPTGEPTRTPATSVVVRPGDTLWTIAVEVDGQADPRLTVDRIIKLNRLTGASVHPGQQLRIPRR